PKLVPTEPVKNSASTPDAPTLSSSLPPVAMAHLPVPMPGAPAAPSAAPAQPQAGISELGIKASAGADGKTLLSLSVDPGPATSLVELPPGNRFGRFTVGAAVGLGSPGGVPNGTSGGGTGGSGSGGNASSGAGP